tara:strand:+ start:228 stop:590 length:363 start_codon:yes stop_codon:yes gene_type:complete
MRLNKETLKRIIKEEMEAFLDESRLLDKYVKSKEEEFKGHLDAMGKPPEETFNALDPNQRAVLGQSLVDGYPGSLDVEDPNREPTDYDLGYDDGLAGLPPSEFEGKYMDGYNAGSNKNQR